MDVVGHQHVGIETKPVASPVVRKSLHISQSVPIVPENLLPLIAPDDDVIKGFFSTRVFLAIHHRYYGREHEVQTHALP